MLRRPLPFGGGTYGSPGLYVEGRPGPHRIFVPPGAVHLQVGGATRLDAGAIHFGAKRGLLSVDAEGEDTFRVSVPISAPAELGSR